MLEKPRELVNGDVGEFSCPAWLPGAVPSPLGLGVGLPGQLPVHIVNQTLELGGFPMPGIGEGTATSASTLPGPYP